MIVNLWSTPRTGSNWYSQYLLKEYKNTNNRTILYQQYLNSFHFYNYYKPNYSDFVYDYQPTCYYKHYYFDYLRKAIVETPKYEPRKFNISEEENYRLKLLNKHDHKKNPSIFYSHVAPMSKISYEYLFYKADKNIFLYRKDFKRQLSSYALAYGTTQYKPKINQTIYENINVNYEVLKNLTDRVLLWHTLDKKGCEVISYEELNFQEDKNLPVQQNKTDPFIQLDNETQDSIYKLTEYLKSNL